MELKAALGTGKRVSLVGTTGGYVSKEEIEDMIAGGELTAGAIFSDGWLVEPVSTIKLTESDFKTIWDEVAVEFASVKSFETSVLAKKLLGRFIAGYKVG